MRGMIVAPQPTAVEEGAKVLQAGGNAVDAALTAAFVQFILDPHCCSAGGYLVATLQMADDTEPRLLDAPALAGSNVTPDMWRDMVLRPNPDGWGYFLQGMVNDVGYQSICTPGAVKGLGAMLERWGTRPWSEVLRPAIDIAEQGFPVSAFLAGMWKEPAPYPEASSPIMGVRQNKASRDIYLNADGSLREAGDRLRNPDYARTLERLAEHGPDDFYQGELAGRIADDLQAHGAFVTKQDLAEYALREPPPVSGHYRGHRVVTSPPPHGGPTLLAILKILEQYDLGALEHNGAEYIRLVSMAMKAAFADRNRELADPAFADVPLDEMISSRRAERWKAVIDRGEPIDVGRADQGPRDTTQVTVVDARGNCVSLTHSRGSGTGGVITPGLGFMYNNSMVNFDPYPGRPNSIAPRKGRTTGMTPTIVYQNDHPLLVLGAPGATRIITSVLQVILNVIDFGMSISDAVLAPRFDCQGDTIVCQARIPEMTCCEVRRLHPIRRMVFAHGHLALVHAIHLDPRTGRRSGAADTGGDGMAFLV